MIGRTGRWLASVLVVVPAGVVGACPICRTRTGEQVRAGIFDGHFGANMVVTVLPFVVFGGVVACIHFGGRRR